MSGGVFISYRREDSSGSARGIYDRLAKGLGRKNVFFDVDSIAPGVDFVELLTERVSACDALLAVIGADWVSSVDKNNRKRVDNPQDFARIEIEAALDRGVRVIPVLVDGATMPEPGELPESLRKLVRLHRIEISHTRFDTDVRKLTRTLRLWANQLRQQEAAEAERLAREDRERREAAEAARIEAARVAEEERRAREAAEAERAARKEREMREAAVRAEEARRLAEEEKARRAEEERRARAAAEAERAVREALERQEAAEAARAEGARQSAEVEAARLAEDEHRAREAAEVERAAREEREKREAAEAAESQRLAEAEAARSAEYECQAREAAAAEHDAHEERDKRETAEAARAENARREAEAEATKRADEERRAKEAADAAHATREEREQRETVEAAPAEGARRQAAAEATRQAKEERRAKKAAEADRAAREEGERPEAAKRVERVEEAEGLFQAEAAARGSEKATKHFAADIHYGRSSVFVPVSHQGSGRVSSSSRRSRIDWRAASFSGIVFFGVATLAIVVGRKEPRSTITTTEHSGLTATTGLAAAADASNDALVKGKADGAIEVTTAALLSPVEAQSPHLEPPLATNRTESGTNISDNAPMKRTGDTPIVPPFPPAPPIEFSFPDAKPVRTVPLRPDGTPIASLVSRIGSAMDPNGWIVELSGPQSELEHLKIKYSADLKDSTIDLYKTLASGEKTYRLRVVGLTSANAEALCARLKGDGGDCSITK